MVTFVYRCYLFYGPSCLVDIQKGLFCSYVTIFQPANAFHDPQAEQITFITRRRLLTKMSHSFFFWNGQILLFTAGAVLPDLKSGKEKFISMSFVYE
jgi:hypothetical protein